MIPTLEIERESARLDAERENQREHWDGSAADVSALRARVTKLADDFPLYEGLNQTGAAE